MERIRQWNITRLNVRRKEGSSNLGSDSELDIVQCLSDIGSRFTLSFAFMFLKKLWKDGDDAVLCTEILQVGVISLVACFHDSIV